MLKEHLPRVNVSPSILVHEDNRSKRFDIGWPRENNNFRPKIEFQPKVDDTGGKRYTLQDWATNPGLLRM